MKGGTPIQTREKAMVSNESIVTGSLVEDDSSASGKKLDMKCQSESRLFSGTIRDSTFKKYHDIPVLQQVWQDNF